MSLKEILLQDMKAAMRNKDRLRKNAIQMARSAVLQVEKDNKTTLDDDGIIEVISKEVKKRKDSLPIYKESGREDMVNDLEKEIDILMGYLPEQLVESELEEIVRLAVADTQASSVRDIGKVMKEVMPKVKGRADGKEVNRIVRNLLQ